MIKCSSRIIAHSFPPLPPAPVRPSLGSGATVGPIRRIITAALITCTSVTALAAPPLIYYFGPTKGPILPATGVTSVPEPSALALYALALAFLFFLCAIRRTRHHAPQL